MAGQKLRAGAGIIAQKIAERAQQLAQVRASHLASNFESLDDGVRNRVREVFLQTVQRGHELARGAIVTREMGEGITQLFRAAVGELNQCLRQGQTRTNRRTQVVHCIRPQLPDACIRGTGAMIHHHARGHQPGDKPEHAQGHQLANQQKQQGQGDGTRKAHPGEGSRGQRVHPGFAQRHDQRGVGGLADRFLPLRKTGEVHQAHADAQN